MSLERKDSNKCQTCQKGPLKHSNGMVRNCGLDGRYSYKQALLEEDPQWMVKILVIQKVSGWI